MTGSTTKDFYVDQTLCAGCSQPIIWIGLHSVDAIRKGGKEPALCGTCLVALKERLLEGSRSQESEDDLPD
jgi:hypothetical protein